MSDFDSVFAELSREPDLDAPELLAYDSADALILATAADEVQRAGVREVVVIGDRHGALTLGATVELGAREIRTHQDPVLGERALAQNAKRLGAEAYYSAHSLGPSLLEGARVVMLQLPKGLDALDEIAWSIARWATPDVRVYAGGRVKHMTLAQNAVLAKYFGEVSAGLAQRKARVITAAVLREDLVAPKFPVWGVDQDLPFSVAAHGATFGGATLDHGSRLLLSSLGAGVSQEGTRAPHRIVDLGCGNGSLAVSAALRWPSAQVFATDQSAAAVAATRLTAEAAGVLAADNDAPGVSVYRADSLEVVPDGWAELILLNPPFHSGATVHAGVAHRLIRACRRTLAPGGELRIVFNSHLKYRPLIERAVGPATEIARNRTFTVLSARR